MATNLKGPGIYLAQFAGDAAPFNSWPAITRWAASLGFKGVQVPSWDTRLFDLAKAAESKTYCDEFAGMARNAADGKTRDVGIGNACRVTDRFDERPKP